LPSVSLLLNCVDCVPSIYTTDDHVLGSAQAGDGNE